MKKIKLTQGKIAIVDDSDYTKIGNMKWCAQRIGKHYYAVRGNSLGNYFMHRVIVNPPKNRLVDHANHNTLDNRRKNLRICSKRENCRNQSGLRIDSTSGYRGVSWEKRRNKWVAYITVYKRIHLGYFDDIKKAAHAYAKANRKYFGSFGGSL